MAGGSSVLVLWGLGWLPRGLPGLLALLLYRLLLSSGWFLAGGWEPSFKRLVSGVTPKPALEDEEAFLFSGSSVAAFKFPRELASREFMEKLNGKHRWGGINMDNDVYSHRVHVSKTRNWHSRNLMGTVLINANGTRMASLSLLVIL